MKALVTCVIGDFETSEAYLHNWYNIDDYILRVKEYWQYDRYFKQEWVHNNSNTPRV